MKDPVPDLDHARIHSAVERMSRAGAAASCGATGPVLLKRKPMIAPRSRATGTRKIALRFFKRARP
jgi:hypothetical protein